MIYKTIRELFDFIKKPDDRQVKPSLKTKFQLFLILFALEVILTLIIIIPIIEQVDDVLNLNYAAGLTRFTFTESLLILVIVIPFAEELVFRYFLRYKGLKTMLISENRWQKIFPFLVYLFAVSFGLLHITNYSNDSMWFYALAPLIVLSQISGGLIMSFIRVRLNFGWGFLYHATWNLLFVILVPVIEDSFTAPYSEKTERYEITIEEKLFFEKDLPTFIKIDSSNGKIRSVSADQISIQNLMDTLFVEDRYKIEDVLIDLTFSSSIGVKREEFIKILGKEYEIEKQMPLRDSFD